MNRIKFAALFIILFIISACQDKIDNIIDPEPIIYEPLIPLSVGNYWLYREYDLNSDGSGGTPHLDKFGFVINKLPAKINSDLSIKKYQISRCGEDLNPIDDSKYLEYGGSKSVCQNEKGFYYSGIIRKDSLVLSFDDLMFPFIRKRGESVSGHIFYYSVAGNYLNVSDDVITQYICVSTDSLFTTPIGDFRCLVYKMVYVDINPLFRDEVYYFIKPGLGIVGMVQLAYHYNSNNYSYLRKTLLIDYKLN